MRTNQNSTPNPSPEGDQSDPETPVFWIFHGRIPYISNVTQSSGLLPIAAASVSVGAQLELGNKNSLAFASDIGSLVVIGRSRDLGTTETRLWNGYYTGQKLSQDSNPGLLTLSTLHYTITVSPMRFWSINETETSLSPSMQLTSSSLLNKSRIKEQL